MYAMCKKQKFLDGYYKLLVIKEYLTKFVRVYPLRSKEKEEVAENLWKWISLYGPPKQVLSDQGGEFMNHVMDSLLNKLGIEKRVTSAYSPRTDGCTEKANDTIVTVLRSHAESDHINWIKWISFVEYAYNTRRHSSTNYSPYELLFGIKPNAFVDYRQDLNSKSDEIEDVKARSIQLKT
jgi:transposase InsO family protein